MMLNSYDRMMLNFYSCSGINDSAYDQSGQRPNSCPAFFLNCFSSCRYLFKKIFKKLSMFRVLHKSKKKKSKVFVKMYVIVCFFPYNSSLVKKLYEIYIFSLHVPNCYELNNPFAIICFYRLIIGVVISPSSRGNT